jgi:predicted neuraminidase
MPCRRSGAGSSMGRIGGTPTVTRWLPHAIFLAALYVASLRALTPMPPAFVTPPQAIHSTLPAEFAREELPAMAPIAHASSLTELADGRLAAVWYAGSGEGALDVKLWFSIRDAEGWSPPRVVATPADTSAGVGAYVRKLGNPVIYARGKRLHLWYVSVAAGGWSGSSISYKSSDDDGQNWLSAERLTTSPLFNLGTLVRGPPVALADGGFGLPVYQELFTRRAEWLRIDASGRTLDKVRLPSPAPGLQPSVAATDAQNGLALLRSGDTQRGVVMADVTADGGASWHQVASLPIANRNTSLALLRLGSGRLLLAANPYEGRSLLQLFLSNDDGNNWWPARVIEDDPNKTAEYSYPALVQTRDGRIHLSYTFQFRTIAHAIFTEAALTEGIP